MIALLALLLAVVNSPNPSITYACDGVTAAYTVSFPYQASGDLQITSTTPSGTATILAQTTDWTVNLASTSSTATLTLSAPATKCPSGNTLKIARNLALTQPTSFKAQTTFTPTLHEQVYDRTVMQIQQVDAKVGATDIKAYVDAAINNTLTGGTVVQPLTWALTGDGTTSIFSIPNAVVSNPDLYMIVIDGLLQKPTVDYTVSSVAATVTFSSAPAFNAVISVRSLGYARALSIGDNTQVLATGSTVPQALKDWMAQVGLTNVKAFGAVGNGIADDAPAIQAAINSLTAGTVYFPCGRYLLVSAALAINKPGISLRGCAPANQLASSSFAMSEIVGGGTLALLLRYGDPAEATGDVSHIYPGGAIENMTFTGTAITTSGVRIYNTTVQIRNSYITNVMGAGGIGLWLKRAWASTISNVATQSNAGTDIWIDVNNSGIVLMNGFSLSNTASDGIHLMGGSNSISIESWDVEGKANGLVLDTTSNTLLNLNLRNLNFESNVTQGITQSGANAIQGLTYIGGRHNGAGNGAFFNNVAGGFITGLVLNGPNLSFSGNPSDVVVGKISLSGGSTLTGIYKTLLAVEELYEDNPTVGALAYTFDAGVNTSNTLNLTAACTAVTYTINNTSTRPKGSKLRFTIGNTTTATVGGAVTFPAAFKKTAAVVIPAANTRTTIEFISDGNNLWWESSRAVNAT